MEEIFVCTQSVDERTHPSRGVSRGRPSVPFDPPPPRSPAHHNLHSFDGAVRSVGNRANFFPVTAAVRGTFSAVAAAANSFSQNFLEDGKAKSVYTQTRETPRGTGEGGTWLRNAYKVAGRGEGVNAWSEGEGIRSYCGVASFRALLHFQAANKVGVVAAADDDVVLVRRRRRRRAALSRRGTRGRRRQKYSDRPRVTEEFHHRPCK